MESCVGLWPASWLSVIASTKSASLSFFWWRVCDESTSLLKLVLGEPKQPGGHPHESIRVPTYIYAGKNNPARENTTTTSRRKNSVRTRHGLISVQTGSVLEGKNANISKASILNLFAPCLRTKRSISWKRSFSYGWRRLEVWWRCCHSNVAAHLCSHTLCRRYCIRVNHFVSSMIRADSMSMSSLTLLYAEVIFFILATTAVSSRPFRSTSFLSNKGKPHCINSNPQRTDYHSLLTTFTYCMVEKLEKVP